MNPGMRNYEPIPGVEGVTSGGTATIKIPSNRRHLMLKIFAQATDGTGTTKDPVRIFDRVTTMVGTKVIREETAAQLVAIRAFNKLPADAETPLCLYYADPARSDVLDEVVTAWDTFGDAQNMVLKLKFLSGLTGISVTVIDCFDGSVLTNAQGGKIRQIVKRSPITYNLGTDGSITTIPVDLPILGIYLIGEAGKTIDHVKVTVDDTTVVHDLDSAQNQSFLADYNLDGSQFHYALRFDVEGQITRRLEGIRSLALRVTSSAAQSVTALVEYVAPDYI